MITGTKQQVWNGTADRTSGGLSRAAAGGLSEQNLVGRVRGPCWTVVANNASLLLLIVVAVSASLLLLIVVANSSPLLQLLVVAESAPLLQLLVVADSSPLLQLLVAAESAPLLQALVVTDSAPRRGLTPGPGRRGPVRVAARPVYDRQAMDTLRVRLENLLDAPTNLNSEDYAEVIMVEDGDDYRTIDVGRDVVLALFRCCFEQLPRVFWALGEGVAWTTEWDGTRSRWTPHVRHGSPLANL